MVVTIDRNQVLANYPEGSLDRAVAQEVLDAISEKVPVQSFFSWADPPDLAGRVFSAMRLSFDLPLIGQDGKARVEVPLG
jgi:hypothetical protein